MTTPGGPSRYVGRRSELRARVRSQRFSALVMKYTPMRATPCGCVRTLVECGPMEIITVRKLDHTGRQVTAYPGQVLRRDEHSIVLHTGWDRAPMDLGFVVLEPGDHWTEYFYADRWYNIFEICASDGRLKGWYCNVTRPAHITGDEVAAEDLALDLWVAPDGETQLLDEDEFAALPLLPPERDAAWQALGELQAMAAQGMGPFGKGWANG